MTSGLLQLTVGVWLGWAVLAFVGGRTKVGPLVARRPTLQCHLDNIMMGGLQLAVAGAVSELPAVPVLLLLFGSWVNPQLFLAMAIGFSPLAQAASASPASDAPGAARPRSGLRRVTPAIRWASFSALTLAYPWLAIANL